MCTRSKIWKDIVLGIWFFMIAVPVLWGQITVSTVLQQPYDAPFDQLKNQIVVNVINTSGVGFDEVYLSMEIAGDNGINVKTTAGFIGTKFSLGGSQSFNGLSGDLDDLFTAANLLFTGITQAEAYANGLPEGNYDLCFTVLEVSLVPLSQPGCTMFTIFDFTNVTVNTVVVPPYNAPFDQFKNQVSLTVTNPSTSQNFSNWYARLYIEGDNGIVIQSNAGGPSGLVFNIQEMESRTFLGNSGALDGLFQANNLTFMGIAANEVYANGLPAGSYSLCFQVFDSDGGPRSPEPPGGCAMFNIMDMTNVTVSTVVVPPYNAPFDQFKNQVSLTVTNPSTSQNFSNWYARLYIEGDNGIVIQSNAGGPSGLVFDIQEMESRTFLGNSGALDGLFQANNLTFSGIAANEVYANGLPAGSYSLCFQVFDSDGGPRSPEPPGGCAMFNIMDMTNVTVSSVVVPPYTAPFDQFKNQVSLTVTNPSPSQNFSNWYARLYIEGDNGIVIQSNAGGPSGLVFNIQAMQALTFLGNSGALDGLFQANNLTFMGIAANEVYANGLPAGSYSLCFQVFDSDGGPRSPEPPGGCAMFNIMDMTNVTVSTVVVPPYNAPFDQFKNQVSLTVTNPSPSQNFSNWYARLYIEGDNGIVIQSNAGGPSGLVFNIQAMQAFTFFGNSGALDGLFQANNLTFMGIAANEVYANGLPAGSYSLCFQVFDSDGGPRSPEPPGGCAMFNIMDVTNVSVNTQVVPPYSTDPFAYGTSTIVILQSAQSGDVSLFLDFKGDNGIHLQTVQNYLPNNIVLSGTPLTLGAFDLEPYFSFQNLNSLGIPMAQLQQDGLPPGQYQLCVSVRNGDGEFISGEDPMGCSNFFSINALEPPQLINPICGDSLTTGSNNIVFSWTTPPGTAPATTEYTLKVIELLPGQDPNQAFLSSTVPPFYEKSVLTQTSALYGPMDPPLETGKSYAWQVIAKDDQLNTPFVNDGKSEVCWFTWNPVDIVQNKGGVDGLSFQFLAPTKDTKTIVVSEKEQFYVSWGWLYNGVLENTASLPIFKQKDIQGYRLRIHPGKQKPGQKTDPSFTYETNITTKDNAENLAVAYFQKTDKELQQLKLKDDHWYNIEVEALNSGNAVVEKLQTQDFHLVFQNNKTGPTAHITGQLQYEFDGYAQDYPIPYTSVRFYKGNKEAGALNGQEYFTETGPEGKFELDIPLPNASQDTEEYRLEIVSPYYKQVDSIFKITSSTKVLQLGQLVTKAYNYALKLNVNKGFKSFYKQAMEVEYYNADKKTIEKKIDSVTFNTEEGLTQEIPAGLTVQLYRKKRPSYLPPNEGQFSKTTAEAGIIKVAEGKTAIEIDGDGKKRAYVKFDKLVCNVYKEDIYYLKAVDPEKKEANGESYAYTDGPFEAPEQELRFERPPSSGDSTHFDIELDYNIISKDPPKSTISGQLVYSWPSDKSNTPRPLANTGFSVVVEYIFNNKPFHFKFNPYTGHFNSIQLDNEEGNMNSLDNGQVMATGITDSNGRFTIQVLNLNKKGVLGNGTETSNEGKNPFVLTVPTEKDIKKKDMIINPANGSLIYNIGDLAGVGGKDIFDFNNIGTSFGTQLQTNQLNGSMNSGLDIGANNLIIGLGLNSKFQDQNKQKNNSYFSLGSQRHVFVNKLADMTWFLPPVQNSSESSSSTVQRVYRIRINANISEFYYNPDKNIVVDPFDAKDVGIVDVKVREVKWHFTGINAESNAKLSGLKAVIFRDPSSKLPHLPQGEGDGQYLMDKLINPKYSGKVTKPTEKSGNTKKNSGMGQKVNWEENQQNYSLGELSTAEVLTGDHSWPEDTYEWLASGVTSGVAVGEVSFDRLLGGFKDYWLEMVSNPDVGSAYFYDANLQNIDANSYNLPIAAYKDNIKPNTNATYAGYWDTKQIDIPQANLVVKMQPLPARVGGRVMDKGSGQGVANANVVLSKKGFIEYPFDNIQTDSSGYFEFLDVFDKAGEKGLSLNARMRAYAKGYKQQKESGSMDYKKVTVGKIGEQYVDNILMVPTSGITGIVHNEDNQPVEAYILRPDGLSVLTYGFKSGLLTEMNDIKAPPMGSFNLPTAVDPGETAEFYIVPMDVGYFPDTLKVKITKEGLHDIKIHKVFRRAHRFKIIVTDADDEDLRIGNATIALNKLQPVLTKPNGEAEFNFENVSVNNYTLSISGPPGKGYIPQVVNLKNEESKTIKVYSIKLKKGGSIDGLVTLDGKPVQGAKVYLDYKEQNTGQFAGSYKWKPTTSNKFGENPNAQQPETQALGKATLPQIATYSDVNGQYRLNGIPIASGQVTLFATLDTVFTVIGDQKKVQLVNGLATQNLELKSFGDMLVQSIYGFPLTVESITATNDNNVVNVTGIVALDKSSSPFTWITSEQALRVRNVPFAKKKIGGNTVGIPVNAQAGLDAVSSLKMQYMNKYNVLIANSPTTSKGASGINELTLQRAKDNKGQMQGYVNIVDNSFNYPSSYLNFKNKDQFYLGRIDNNIVNTQIPVFDALGTDGQPVLNPPSGQLVSNQSYHLSNNQGKPIKFNFIGFDATAEPKNSFIDAEGKIHLDVSMDCKIPNAQPDELSVHAGDIILDNSKVYPAAGAKPLSVQLENWTLEIRDWTIDPIKGGIYSKNGLIKTGKVDIPFTNFNLRSDMFDMRDFQVYELKLGGGVKLLTDIAKGNAIVVFDPKSGVTKKGHWKLAVTGTGQNPAAKIRDFGGILNRDINIQYIQLLSNGEDIFSLQQSETPYTINGNGVARFSPSMIQSETDFFTITGGLDITAPRLVPFMTFLRFTGTPNNLKMALDPVQMGFEGRGYVNFTADKSIVPIIEKEKIEIKGKVEEKSAFNPIPATFYADGSIPSSAHYHVDVEKDFVLDLTSDPASKGSLVKQNYNLKIDNGNMEVVANDWNLLSFSGNLLTTDKTLKADGGKQNNKMTFTVHGDMDVSGEAIKVSNIDSPFGKMTMVYDFGAKALHGTIKVNDQTMGPFSVGGTVDMLMDPKGWYFLGVGKVKTGMPGPLSDMNMGFLLGNRSITKTQTDIVSQYSYDKSNLCWLTEGGGKLAIEGLFITAGKSILDKELGFDYALASWYLRAKAGAEASMYTDFKDWNLMMSAGLYGGVEAGASILGVSASGEASLNGSLTGAVGGKGFCIGGDIGAHIQGKLSVYNPVGDDPSVDIEEDAHVSLEISSKSGMDASFHFGSAALPTCTSKGTCNN